MRPFSCRSPRFVLPCTVFLVTPTFPLPFLVSPITILAALFRPRLGAAEKMPAESRRTAGGARHDQERREEERRRWQAERTVLAVPQLESISQL